MSGDMIWDGAKIKYGGTWMVCSLRLGEYSCEADGCDEESAIVYLYNKKMHCIKCTKRIYPDVYKQAIDSGFLRKVE